MLKIKEDHSNNCSRDHLKFYAGAKNFVSNSAKIWNSISTKMDANVNYYVLKLT